MNFKTANKIVGWVVFTIALVVYTITMEKSASFWDCGEFIAAAQKLQIVHPPGAPLWIMLGRIFTLPMGDNPALGVNFLSALSTAFAALFVFWSTTIFAKRLIKGDTPAEDFSTGDIIAMLGSGVVAAFAFVFQDSQWFNAAEAEVYALSTCLTAAVFYLALKWSDTKDRAYANRYLIAIFYLVGLSIGVHLLNLLVIPAIALLMYFFKSKTVSIQGGLLAFVIGIATLLFIQYGVIIDLPEIGSGFELFFVNNLGLPFGTGMLTLLIIMFAIPILLLLSLETEKNKLFYTALGLIAIVALGVFFKVSSFTNSAFKAFIILGIGYGFYHFRNQKSIIYKASLGFLFIMIGYLSYLFVPIRSAANPPIDLNNPDNVFSLLSYLKREQYGDRPLLFGQKFTADYIDVTKVSDIYAKTGDGYVDVDDKLKAVYAPEDKMLLSRVWQKSRAEDYKAWLGLSDGQEPSFIDNIKFFFTYQLDFMYWRYFMWNFAGRQNSVQADGSGAYGNWESGISIADDSRTLKAYTYPDTVNNNPSVNHFFLIPFILGIIGLVFHFYFAKKDGIVLSALFLFTGVAIVVYLNQEPNQPRERDYSYVGSFMAYALWVGLAVAGLYRASKELVWNNILNISVYIIAALGTFFLMGLGTNNPSSLIGILLILLIVFGLLYGIAMYLKKSDNTLRAGVITALALIAPILMGFVGWDDHHRHSLSLAEATGSNYLNSLEPNAILFTEGDNDTYPLWHVQEVKKIRPDVRMVNNSLLKAAWYADQVQQHNGFQPGIELSFDSKDYTGKRDRIYHLGEDLYPGLELEQLIQYIRSDDKRTKYETEQGEIDILPTRVFALPINKDEMVANKVITPKEAEVADSVLYFALPQYKTSLDKDEFLIYDIIQRNINKRPIYFTSENLPTILGIDPYIVREGNAIRIVPQINPLFGTEAYDSYDTRINFDKTLDYLENKAKWGGITSGVFLKDTAQRQVLRTFEYTKKLMTHYTKNGEKEKALRSYAIIKNYIQPSALPKDEMFSIYYYTDIADALFQLGETEEAVALSKRVVDSSLRQLIYAGTANMDFDFQAQIIDTMPSSIYTIKEMAQDYTQPDLEKWVDEQIEEIEKLME